MKTYEITFVSSGTMHVNANSEEEARQLFESYYWYDAGEQMALDGIDLTDADIINVQEEEM